MDFATIHGIIDADSLTTNTKDAAHSYITALNALTQKKMLK